MTAEEFAARRGFQHVLAALYVNIIKGHPGKPGFLQTVFGNDFLMEC